MASNNDHVWSHNKKEENMVSKSLKFGVGDIVILDLNLENKVILLSYSRF